VTEEVFEIKLNGERVLCKKGEPLAVCLYRSGVKQFNYSSKHQRSRGFTNLDWWMPERLQSEQDSFLNPYAAINEKGLSLKTPKTGVAHRLLTKTVSKLINSEFPHRPTIRKPPFWRLTSSYLRRDLPHPLPSETKGEAVEPTILETDVLVVGSGISGICFAVKLKELGGKVAVIEGDHICGGHAVYDESTIDSIGKRARDYVETVLKRAKDERVPLLTDVVFNGFFDDGALGIRLGGLRADAPMLLKAKFFVFATGLRDLPCLFENNDLPGHMVASSALKLANYYGVKPGSKGVVIGDSEYAVRTALQLKKIGTSVTLVTGYGNCREVRKEYLAGLQEEGVEITTVVKKMRAEGRGKLEFLTVDDKKLAADFVASAGCWSPALELFGQAGIHIGYSHWMNCLLPMHGWYGQTANPSVFVIGRSSGVLDEHISSAFAEATAYHIAKKLKLKVNENQVMTRLNDAKETLSRRYPQNYEAYCKLVNCCEAGEVLNEPRPKPVYAEDPRKVFVCVCEDVTLDDIYRGVKVHGFQDIELLKRYTGIGTGKCQGKICLTNVVYAISDLTGKPPSVVGTFRQRPMVVTTSLESLEALRS